MAVGKPLHLRLFLEGIEIPIISAAVSINTNAPSSCAVQVVPLDEAMNLKPRTMAHVFFLDSKAKRNSDGSLAGGLDESYKLLFAGEVVGFSTILTPQSRAVILQCLDFSSYWDSAHAMAIEYGPGGNAFTNYGSLAGGSTGLFDDIVNQQANRILGWLSERPRTPGLETVSGLAGGIIRMMEAMGGVIPHHKGINDFFTVSELRTRLLNQITAEENDSTARRVMGAKVFDEWLRNGLQNIGQKVTFRDMMMLLMKYIYYDFVPNPTAKFTDTEVTTKTLSKRINLTNMQKAQKAKALLQDAREVIIKATAQDIGGEPIRTNTIYVINKIVEIDEVLTAARSERSDLSAVIERVKGILMRARERAQSVLRETAVIGNSIDNLKIVGKLLRDAYRVLDDSTTTTKRVTVIDKTKSQRLRAHIFRPDCWFAPAPVCNVIFPEQFSQVSYDRNFTGEVTRLLVSVYSTLIGKDALFADRTLAPHNGFNVEALVGKGSLNQYRVLLDHELHTGIIPRSEWLPNTSSVGSRASDKDAKTSKGKRLQWADRIALFHFFKYRFAPRQIQVAGRFNPYVVCGFPGVIIRRPFVIPPTNSFLTKKKQELANIEGGSNDLLQLIMSNPDDLGAPAQFLGMIGAVQHSVSQEGGSTVVAMSHARTHLGIDDDFINIFLEQQKKSVKRIVKMTVNYDDAQFVPATLKLLADVTPSGDPVAATAKSSKKTLSKVVASAPRKSRVPSEAGSQVVSASFSVVKEGDEVASAAAAPPFTTFGRIEAADIEEALVPMPPGKIMGKSGPHGGKVVGVEVHRDGAVIEETQFGRVFQSVTIYEEITVPVSQKIPLEQVMRPSWFSTKYDNRVIGREIYQPFFGCNSVIDATLGDLRLAGLDVSDTDNTPVPVEVDVQPEDVLKTLILQETSKASATVERSVNLIGYLYGQVRSKGLDVEEFIRQFNDRPIATLGEILGSNLDFAFDPALKRWVPQAQVESVDTKFGFHSAAIHPRLVEAGGLAGLIDDPQSGFNLIGQTGKKEPLSDRYDVRKAKRDQVLAYRSAFNTTRAFRG